MKLKKMYIEVDGKRILMGEVEIFEYFDIPYNMVNPIEVEIKKITLFKKERDFVNIEEKGDEK